MSRYLPPKNLPRLTRVFPTRYLTLFMNLLNDTESQGEKEVSEHGYQTEESTALRNATIQAMSNLLGANIDSGLSYSLRES